MSLLERKGLYFGANITGSEGGSTTVECDDLGNDLHYTLVEVDAEGAVVKDKDRHFARLSMSNYKKMGSDFIYMVTTQHCPQVSKKACRLEHTH